MAIYTKTGQATEPLAGGGDSFYGHGDTGVRRQWQRGDLTATTWSDIPGATGDSYTIATEDRGFLIRVVEYNYNYVGFASAPADATEPVYISETGSAEIDFVGSGPDAEVFTKSGSAAAPFTGHGADADVAAERGSGVSALTGHGADAYTDSDTGKGVAAFAGGGTHA